jgi:hypothetical protein
MDFPECAPRFDGKSTETQLLRADPYRFMLRKLEQNPDLDAIVTYDWLTQAEGVQNLLKKYRFRKV